MKNYQIKGVDGKMYWVHRSIAVASFVFKLEDEKFSILANKRGKGTPDNQGKWNCPCGYLDYDETLAEAAAREVYEECGLKITADLLVPFELNDSPDAHMQNVTFRHYAILTPDVIKKLGGLTKGEGGEEDEFDEVDEVKWIPVEEIGNYEWAYHHDEIIKRVMG